jgi:hypothetical protein
MPTYDRGARCRLGTSRYAVVIASMLIVATASHALNKCSATGMTCRK